MKIISQYSTRKYIIFTLGVSAVLTACSADGATSTSLAAKTESCTPGTEAGKSDAGLDIVQLCIDIKDGDSVKSTQSFHVEVAASPAQQARGLMFRTSLDDDKGMIFPYQSPQILSFWMKNTVISLDIIFINQDGSIANIAQDTIPYSLDSVSSINPAIAVLEVRAGLTKELGIKKGDIIRWK